MVRDKYKMNEYYLQPYLLKSDWLKNVKLYNLFIFFSSNIYRNYRIDSNF